MKLNIFFLVASLVLASETIARGPTQRNYNALTRKLASLVRATESKSNAQCVAGVCAIAMTWTGLCLLPFSTLTIPFFGLPLTSVTASFAADKPKAVISCVVLSNVAAGIYMLSQLRNQ